MHAYDVKKRVCVRRKKEEKSHVRPVGKHEAVSDSDDEMPAAPNATGNSGQGGGKSGRMKAKWPKNGSKKPKRAAWVDRPSAPHHVFGGMRTVCNFGLKCRGLFTLQGCSCAHTPEEGAKAKKVLAARKGSSERAHRQGRRQRHIVVVPKKGGKSSRNPDQTSVQVHLMELIAPDGRVMIPKQDARLDFEGQKGHGREARKHVRRAKKKVSFCMCMCTEWGSLNRMITRPQL